MYIHYYINIYIHFYINNENLNFFILKFNHRLYIREVRKIDPTIIYGIAGSLGGLFGAISIIWNIKKHRQEQKKEQQKELQQYLRDIRPNIDIEYREVQRIKAQGKKLVLGEIILTNKAVYEMIAVGFFLSISNLNLKGLPPVLLKDNIDNDNNEIHEEFGNFNLLKKTHLIYTLLGAEYAYKYLHKVEHRQEDLSREKGFLEANREKNYLSYSTMKYSLKDFFYKYLSYTLDPGVPLVIPIIFEYSGEGFYFLKFGLSAIPNDPNWEESAATLGIVFKKQTLEFNGKTVSIPRVSFAEEYVRYVD